MAENKGSIYEFDNFRLVAAERLLTRDGEPVAIPAKAFDLLVALVENNGHLVEKETLYNRVWADAIVEDANLTVQMSAIRKALGNGYIKTVKGHGYRFAADVRELNGHREEFVVEEQTFARVTVEHEIEAENRELAAHKTLATSPNTSMMSKVAAAAIACVTLLVAGFWYLKTTDSVPDTRRPKLTRLTSSGNVQAATSTHDGKYAVLVLREKEGESLWLRQIETGSQTRITQPGNFEYLGLTVSPDGNFVYATVFEENIADPPLRKIPILGGPPQEVPNVIISSSIAFSHDGKRITYVESHQPETHVMVANADGTDERTLVRAHNHQREFPIWKYYPVAWSPDDMVIAAGYSETSETGSQAGITLVDPSDGREQNLLKPAWAHIDEVAWLDADNLVFIANEDEWANQIWVVNRKSGAVRRITNDLNKYRWLTAIGGKLLTTQVTAVSSLYIADAGNDVKSVRPREIARESGYFSNVAWARDGSILFSSATTGRSEIWQIDTDGKNAQQLTADANIFFGIAVSPNDGSIVYSAKHGRKFSIWKTDASGKNARQITDGVEDFAPDVSSNNIVVFQTSAQKVMRISPADNAPVELHRGLKPVVSPDGGETAFFMMDESKWKIGIVATDTGRMLKKIELPADVRQRRMRWHPSGEYLSLFFEEGNNLKLLCVPINGDASWVIDGFGTGDPNSFDWSADGEQIVYSVTTETQDAIMLSDF